MSVLFSFGSLYFPHANNEFQDIMIGRCLSVKRCTHRVDKSRPSTFVGYLNEMLQIPTFVLIQKVVITSVKFLGLIAYDIVILTSEVTVKSFLPFGNPIVCLAAKYII